MAGGKVLVVVSTGEKEKALAGMLWAWNMKKKGLLDDVRVYLFGPIEKLVAEGDSEVRFRIRLLLDQEIEVLACHGIAELGGYREKLEDFLGEDRVTHVGRLIAERIREGYIPLVF